MSLRSIPTLDGDGEPLSITIVQRQAVVFSNPAVTLNSVNDDGITITANITFANGNIAILKLFQAPYYSPIATFTDDEIDERVQYLVAAYTE